MSEEYADSLNGNDMAERYYFRLRGPSEVLEDEKGVLASSIEVAVAEATQIIADMRARNELPDPCQHWSLEIHDDAGIVLRSFQLY
ncbi:DUF6894 family protein [Methylobacterium phyllosphaerae]